MHVFFIICNRSIFHLKVISHKYDTETTTSEGPLAQDGPAIWSLLLQYSGTLPNSLCWVLFACAEIITYWDLHFFITCMRDQWKFHQVAHWAWRCNGTRPHALGMWAQGLVPKQVFLSPPPMSAKSSNKFGYDMYCWGVPTTCNYNPHSKGVRVQDLVHRVWAHEGSLH